VSPRLTALVAAVVAALALAAPASAATLRGTVVHLNHHAHKVVVATKGGRMVAIHSRRTVRVGRVVRVNARRLRNGTFAARSIRVLGTRHRARLRGTVTYVNGHRRLFTLSSRGASVLLHARRARAARAIAADDAMPQSGSQVVVDSDIDDQGDLEAKDIKDEGDDEDGIELEGKVLAVNRDARTLSVSADDDDESGEAVTVDVPGSFDITQFKVGDEVELVITKQTDGSFLLQKADTDEDDQADDDDTKGDDDADGAGSGDD
jgi:predicted  nucleic acid-binding Zn-ribbon protein